MSRKILVIRLKPLKYFIQCIPAFAAIRKFHKDDEVYILTEKDLIKFCKRSGFFDKVWLDSKPEWVQLLGVKDLSDRLRAMNFDMVYDLQNDKRSAWYFKIIGFKKPMWNSSVVNWCSHPHEVKDEDIHFQDIIHEQLKVAGIGSTPQIDISFMADDDVSDLPKKYAMICSGGDREKLAHKWHPVKYAEVIDYLHETHGITSVLVGDGGDDLAINSLVARQCVKAKPLNYSGRSDVNRIITVAKNAMFCLGNETAPTHIAAYTGCKTIMICSRFSPSELVAPKVKNLALIEEPMLEDVETDRAIRAIEEFGLVSEDLAIKTYKTAGSDALEKPEVLTKKTS